MKIRLVLGLTLFVVLISAILFYPRSPETILALSPPPMTQNDFLVNEAGIAAYANLGQPLRLDYIASAFRTIEDHTETYIIGSVSVSGYAMAYDAHVYAQTDGWIIAYYDPATPISKIMDWRYRRFTPTLLERALSQVVDKDGLTLPEVQYYDFRYPNATHMMWIKKNYGTFYINIPASFTFYERSWILAADFNWNDDVYYQVDGNTVGTLSGTGNPIARVGFLSAEQLLPDLEHAIRVTQSGADYAFNEFSALVLVYRDPNAIP